MDLIFGIIVREPRWFRQRKQWPNLNARPVRTFTAQFLRNAVLKIKSRIINNPCRVELAFCLN